MARVVTSEDLRTRLGQELDALKGAGDVVYVSRRGRMAGVLLDVERYAEMLDRLDFLEDSLAALQAREELAASVPWIEVRGS
jgi:PHD/YefM family antitoxin component YafN of YafNO toxin-antitoxin module